ncbi:DUF2637 domain-containing protein [Nocardiopsis sp. YSL2]|uniref:DUF2637 domain-containing protein n=1 Tax=Nocardiopsis sp. YSL2 TaxID=2939492 RepID=UPI0026F42EC0|nr:DUF2637 domain-containing protein [Nocardiopsis sp. YSL2]
MDSSRWSRWTTIAAVLMLAVIAAVVSYSHMYELALRNGEPEWRAALFPLSVDGMIVASSMTLLSDARNGRKGGLLPWTLLIIGSGASLAANVAVADPTMWSRIIHAWPSFALIGAYELLMREFRTTAKSVRTASATDEQPNPDALEGGITQASSDSNDVPAQDVAYAGARSRTHVRVVEQSDEPQGEGAPPLQVEAWQWALGNRGDDGELPSGKEIAERFGRKERWGRLIKQKGQRGQLGGAASILVERSSVAVG